jgi:pimeloyl-ACP methyl ester carboxylesterase
MPRRSNRTIVRTSPRVAALRWSLRALDQASPSLAARLGEHLFLTPPRHRAPRHERKALQGGRAFDVAIASGRLRGWRFGRDPRVLFVHGWGGRGSQLLPLAEPLLKAGLSFATFDAPAHGVSTGRTTSVPGFADSVTAIATRLGSVRAVVAHSMGGAATAMAVRNGLRLDAAVFIGMPRNPGRFFGDFVTALALRPSLASAVKARVEGRVGLRMDDLDIQHLIPETSVPLLVVHDKEDKEVAWENGEAIARHWPDARLLTTSGLGHRRVLRDRGVAEQVGAFLLARLGSGEMGCTSPGCDRRVVDCSGGDGGLCASCALEAQLFTPALRSLGAA